MTATATATARLEALEAEAFRAQHQQAQVGARLEHVTNALGDLSQDGRSVALDVREIKTELTQIRTGHGARLERIESTLAGHSARFDGIESRLDGQDARFDRIESRLNGMDARFEGIESRLDGMDSTLTGHGELLRAILARLGGKPEPDSGG